MNRNCYSTCIWGHSLKWGKGGGGGCVNKMCKKFLEKTKCLEFFFWPTGSEGSATKPALFQFIYAVGNILLMNFFC